MFGQTVITNNLPVRYRKTKHIAWLTMLFSQAENLWRNFRSFRLNVRTCINYNSQTLSLQAWLRRIFQDTINVINNFNRIDPTYSFWLFENQEESYDYALDEGETLSTVYSLEEESDSALFYDFIVEVPSSMSSQTSAVRAETNKLKLAGKRFRVIIS